jgi:hypothetical protein
MFAVMIWAVFLGTVGVLAWADFRLIVLVRRIHWFWGLLCIVVSLFVWAILLSVGLGILLYG